jgi:DNA helicase-2/ATP-dependent DNA helicase PcrA
VVGDDDQSIYRWRGAQFKNILELPKVYPNLAIVRLEQNYRSTPNILAGAKSVITKNKDRHEKDLWTERGKGEPIRILATETEEDEAIQVVQLISEAIREGVAPSEIGVLYRTNAQSRVLEESLLRQQIPYRIVGGFAFYQRKEVKVLLSYMKMLVHPHDDLSFLRIVNNPRRGIGQTTLRQLQAKAGSLKISLFETAKNAPDCDEIGSGGARKLETLCTQVQEWTAGLEERALAETLSKIVEDID